MSLAVIIRHYNHQNFFQCFADVLAQYSSRKHWVVVVPQRGKCEQTQQILKRRMQHLHTVSREIRGSTIYSLLSTIGVSVRYGNVPSNAASSAKRIVRANTNMHAHLLRYLKLYVLPVRPRYDHLARPCTMRTQYFLFHPTDR
jgi:hypothetical protein